MATLKLNQVIALQKGQRATAEGALTKAYHNIQKAPLLAGLTKTYAPRDEEGEGQPGEEVRVQLRVDEILRETTGPLARLLDLTATLDFANQQATGDIVVDGEVIQARVPVTTLLTIEKKLVDLRTLVLKLPVLDAAEDWTWDPTTRCSKSTTTKRKSTKKIPRNHVKAAATDKHPAQVEVYYEDTIVGDWSTTLFSGAITAERQQNLLTRVEALQAAVKVARETANMTEAPDLKIGDAIFRALGWIN